MKLYVTRRLHECPASSYVPIRYRHKGGISVSMWDKDNIVFVFRFYWHSKEQYELADVYILPQYRSKMYSKTMKYSTKLMRTVIKMICDMGMKKVWLWTLHDNTKAIALYRKFGFIEVEMHKKRKEAIRKQHKWIQPHQKIIQMNLHV